MDKIFELFNKHSKEIEFSGGYSGSVLLYDGFIKAITEALAERDTEIRELKEEIVELSTAHHNNLVQLSISGDDIQRLLNDNARLKTELSRIKEGVEKLNVLHIGSLSVGKDVVRKSDLDKLMKGGE